MKKKHFQTIPSFIQRVFEDYCAHPTNKYNAMRFHANFVVRNLLDPDGNKVWLPFCVPYISIADDPGPIGKDA